MFPRIPSPLPSFQSLFTLLSVLFRAVSVEIHALPGQVRGLIPRAHALLSRFAWYRGLSPHVRVVRQILTARPMRLPLGFAAAGLVAVIGLTAWPASPGAAGSLSTISNLGPAIAAGHASDVLFASQAVKHRQPAPAQPPAAPAPKKAPADHPVKAKLAVKDKKPAKPAPRKPAHRAPAHRKPVHHRPARITRPYTIYDSIHPGAIPHHKVVATYATGLYAAQPEEVAGQKSVMWIDITGRDYAASVLDVEPGDATPVVAAEWARRRLSAEPHALARIYTMRSEWGAVQAAVSSLKASMRSRIRYWIADPTGSPHVVPGASATQWYWGPNYDITTANPDF